MTDNIKIRADMELSNEQADALVRHAVLAGYLRVEPRRAWGKSERKEAIRFAIRQKIISFATPKRNWCEHQSIDGSCYICGIVK